MGEGGPTYADQSLPQYISAFANEGSSEYIRVGKGRESLSPNFQTFKDPRLQFHGIDSFNILWGL